MTPLEYFDTDASGYLTRIGYGSNDAMDAGLFFQQKEITLETYADIGCGPATSAKPFIKLGARKITGIDGSLNMLKLFTQELTKVRGAAKIAIETIHCDLKTQPLEIPITECDCIGTFGLFNYFSFEETAKLIAHIASLIKNGGYLCGSLSLTEENYSEERDWGTVIAKVHSEKQFLELLEKNNFSILHIKKETGLYIAQKNN